MKFNNIKIIIILFDGERGEYSTQIEKHSDTIFMM